MERELLQVLRMSKPILALQKYMSTSPHAIGQEQTMVLAQRMLREHHIRHLPVLHGARIAGSLLHTRLAT